MMTSLKRVMWFALCSAAACVLVGPLAAQPSRLSIGAISEIVNETLHAVVPPGDSLSRVSIANRKVRLDFDRTISAFGYVATGYLRSKFAIREPAIDGAASLLSDCDDWGTKPCSQLGWSAYVWMEPLSIGEGQAVVRAYVHWPERNGRPFVAGTQPSGPAALVGYAVEVRLGLGADGHWKFLRKGTMTVGD